MSTLACAAMAPKTMQSASLQMITALVMEYSASIQRRRSPHQRAQRSVHPVSRAASKAPAQEVLLGSCLNNLRLHSRTTCPLISVILKPSADPKAVLVDISLKKNQQLSSKLQYLVGLFGVQLSPACRFLFFFF